MKKKIVGICVCMLVIATAVPAVGTLNKNSETNSVSLFPPGVEWEYTYGGDEFDWFYDVQPTTDGGYIAAGITEENNMYYAWLLKADENGVEEWNKVNYEFNGTSIEEEILVQCVRQTPDGGYLVGGMGRYYLPVPGIWVYPGYLWKVSPTGSTEWFIPIANELEGWYYVPFVFENYDGGWICGGFYIGFTSPNDYFMDVGLFKTDLDGNFLWGEHYDVGQDYQWEFVRSLNKTTPDNGYFLSGTSAPNPTSNIGGLCMIKTDSAGTLQQKAIFDGPGYEYGAVMGCCQTPEGGYIMSGITNSYGAGGTDLWIIKTDAGFNEEWNKTYGGPYFDRNYGMDATDDGGYVFTVIKNAYGVAGTKDDTWIINTDSEGNSEWELLIEEEGTQWMQSIVQTADGGFIVAGRTGAMGSADSDGLIMKVAPFPHFEIELKGGLGVKATITNTGLGDAIQVPYYLSVKGGILGLINQSKTGTTDILAGDSKTFTGWFFRLGTITITVKVAVKEITATALVLGPFVLIIKDS